MHRKNMGNYETGCTICTQCSWFIAQYKASYTAFSLNLTKKPIFLFTEKMFFINRCIISKVKIANFFVLYYSCGYHVLLRMKISFKKSYFSIFSRIFSTFLHFYTIPCAWFFTFSVQTLIIYISN